MNSTLTEALPVQQIEVKVENDHIQRLTTAKPIAAISELIWNAYDADAQEVRVELEGGQLTKLGLIRIVDNGTGIPSDEVNTLFQSLGGSWKKLAVKTDRGRWIHGEKGQGRFKAFALGERVTWVSRHAGKKFSISGDKSDLKRFSISDSVSTQNTGCTVEIESVIRDFEIWAKDGFTEHLRDVFALKLYEDPNFRIIYDGEQIETAEAIKDVTHYDVTTFSEDGHEYKATLDIIEWQKRVERKLMLCLPGRFSFHSMAPGIHARGFDFTAYLTADQFQHLADDNTEGLVELDPPSMALVEASKVKLREHFREREAERSRSKIQEWKDSKIYPYEGKASDLIEVNERQIFDVVALNLADYSPEFEKTPSKQQKLILQLVKAAIETGPGALPSILEKVVDLPKGKQEELADLLRKTSLTAVINAAKAVTDRLEFLRALQILIFEANSKRQLLERSQLHRVIAQETWIFGEQFNLMNDDEDLSAVLRSHIELLGSDSDEGTQREHLAPNAPVLDVNGKAAIVDLMLSCRVPTPTDDERKHLVVELKRPSQRLNEEVINQVKKYAKAVAFDDRFHHSNVEWDFVAVANRFTKDAELEARQAGKPHGLVLELDDPIKIRVWARTWGEIIQEAEGRLTFYKRRLEYQANDEEALRYLRTINADYLSDEVKERISALDAEEEAAAD
ncbi:ATP-binding protein [Rhodobium gokarnense]|uniref:REP element-mobilizing transposase RayT n=1 Tax=Rhodobium gokarnense TaxID=364296 RepID=A0ABT3HGH1_9HYPH|nr:ATP-binding protein [Rhodobium gokarnense]MCW2309506.1 REP element-mobilizing transposase RayT [Rhodobium gokarnense]